MTLRFQQIKGELYQAILAYHLKFDQNPQLCYIPISMYDEFMHEIRETAKEPTIKGCSLMGLLPQFNCDHYMTFYGCKLYRSLVKEIDFNVPDWERM